MSDTDEQSERERGAIRHLNEALAAEEMADVDYHVRQALQFLDVE